MADITIPPEALEEAARALKLLLVDLVDADTRATELTDEEHIVLANAACLAVLKTWPKAVFAIEANNAPCIFLPLPMEKQE